MSLIGTKKGRILEELLSGRKMMTELKSIVSSYDVLRYNLLELQTEGYITKKESRDDKRRYFVSLTDKGREVAEQLKKAEQIANLSNPMIPEMKDLNLKMTDEEVEMTKSLTPLFHINVLDDHITVQENPPGEVSRIFNIYIKINGNGEFRLWCEHDDSYDCWHVKAAWTYPHVQRMMIQYQSKMKVCHVCGAENRERAKFCDQCGSKL